jgi:hypothetical protein
VPALPTLRSAASSWARAIGALHPRLARRQLELRAEGGHHPPALHAHALGHAQHEAVALHRRDHGQPDPGVPRGRLDDRRHPGRDQPARLGVVEHRARDAVLDRATRVGTLELHPHLALGEQPGEADVRGVSDRVEDAGGAHGRERRKRQEDGGRRAGPDRGDRGAGTGGRHGRRERSHPPGAPARGARRT